MAIELKTKSDALWAFITGEIRTAMGNGGTMEGARSFSPSWRFHGQPIYPAISTITKRLEGGELTVARSVPTLLTTYRIEEKDFDVERGQETVEELAHILAELFQGSDAWQAYADDLALDSIDMVSRPFPGEIDRPAADVTFRWRFEYLHA